MNWKTSARRSRVETVRRAPRWRTRTDASALLASTVPAVPRTWSSAGTTPAPTATARTPTAPISKPTLPLNGKLRFLW